MRVGSIRQRIIPYAIIPCVLGPFVNVLFLTLLFHACWVYSSMYYSLRYYYMRVGSIRQCIIPYAIIPRVLGPFVNESQHLSKQMLIQNLKSRPRPSLSILLLLFSRLYNVSTSSCAHLTIIISSPSSPFCHSSLLPLIPFLPSFL